MSTSPPDDRDAPPEDSGAGAPPPEDSGAGAPPPEDSGAGAPPPEDSDERPGESGKKATKYDVWAYVIIGLIGIPLFALAVGALVLPPGIAFALVRRGLSESKPAWTILGVITGLLWIALLAASGRKIFGRARAAASADERRKRPQPR